MHPKSCVVLMLYTLVLFAAGKLSAQALDFKKSPHRTWVESEEAHYCTELAVFFGTQVANAQSGELLARSDPKLAVTRVDSLTAWRDFLSEFAVVDEKNEQPRLTSEGGFQPDFQKEIVLVLSATPKMREAVHRFMDIEVWEHASGLKAFVFFGATKPMNLKGQAGPKRLHLVTLPRKLDGKSITFRLGYQSWGRPCSRFSPVVGQLEEQTAPEALHLN
ncbi:MAG: hypothetical protein ACON4R_07925 [Akkermansiaceae bacterium]